MADPALESYFESDTLGFRHISSSLFRIPSFLIGFSAKSSSDSDSVRSPTSPLDFKLFANLSNPFSVRSPRSSSQTNYQKKWDCSKIGLGIVNLLADELKPYCGDHDSPRRKNIIFGPEVNAKIYISSRNSHHEFDSSFKSNSLPRNYAISSFPPGRTPNTRSGESSVVFESERVQLEPKLVRSTASCFPDFNRLPSSLIKSPKSSSLTSGSFCLMNGTPVDSSALPIGRGSLVDDSSVTKPSSHPIPIGSLSAQQIELSEDYTCIISHGPNPKTTHIFCDCILECHNELTNFDEEELGFRVEFPPLPKFPEGSTTYPSDEFLSFCYSCKKKLEKDEDIYIFRGEKAFCSFDCHSEEIFALEEMEKTCSNSSKGSPEPSYHEDLFLMGLPIIT
ncbi:hypothetical protein SLE2022_382720 [Rubroshorea leprosula]